MRKIYSLLVAMVIAIAANAQVIQFAEADIADAGAVNGKVFTNGNFSLSVFDEAGKVAIDANNVYYGDATEQVKFTHRLKSGGKSSLSEGKTNYMTLSVPSDGKIKIYARTGSNSATDRNVVLTQNDTELLNKILLESEAIKVMMGEEEKSVYPAVEADVKAGTVTVTYPVGSINFYAFEFVAAAAPAPSVDADFTATLTQYPTSDYSASYAVFSLAEVAKTLGTDAATLAGALESGAAYAGLVKPLELTEGHTLLVDDLVAAGALQDDVVRFYITNASDASREGWGIGGFANSDNWSPTEMWNGVAGESWVYEYPVSKILEVAGTEPGEWHGVGITINIYNDCKVSKVELVQTQTTADGPGSFWLTSAGERTSWGNNSVIYNSVLGIDADADELAIPVGQFPDAMASGESTSFVLSVVYGEKVATLGVTLNVVARPVMQNPTTVYSALEVVKEYEMPITFTEGKSYEAAVKTLDVSDIYTALGVDAATLDPNTELVTMTRVVVSDESGSIVPVDSIAPSRFGTDGWFGRYTSFDEATGNETALELNYPKTWGANCTYYLQNPTLANGEFSLTVGQYPGTLKAEDVDKAELFIVNGTKAVKITVVSTCEAMEVIPFDQMVKVGEQSVAGKLEVANAYTSVTVDIDINDVIEKLGCGVADMEMWNLSAADAICDPTINDYWLSEEGYSQAWSANPCCQVTVDLANGTMTLLQMAGKYINIEEEQTYPMYFILSNGANYYQFNIQFTLKPVGKIENELHVVSVEEINKQIIPADSYDVEGLTAIDLDYVESLIGTRDFTLYGDVYVPGDGYGMMMTKNYSCYDTANKGFGFWYGIQTYENEEHQVVVDNAGWSGSGENSFGFQIFTNGNIMWFQFPGSAKVGDTWTANMYLVNEATGAYIKYILNVSYVSEITPEPETVLVYEDPKDVTDASYNADGLLAYNIDMSVVTKALGISEDSEEGVVKILAPKSASVFAEITLGEDYFFNARGYMTSESGMALTANLSSDENGLVVTIDPMELDFSKDVAAVSFAFEYEGKRVIYTIVLGENITGINAVAADKASVKKVVRDGSVVIVKNGQEFNVTGARIK